MMETTIIERAVTVALQGGASSINADAATALLRVIAELRQERDALQAQQREYADALNLAEQRFTGERDALRAELARMQALAAQAQPLAAQLTSERDALQAWRDAVPMKSLGMIREQLDSERDWTAFANWIDAQDGAA